MKLFDMKLVWLTVLFYLLQELKVSEAFSVFWNVPTKQCEKYGIYFNLSEFNIIQNDGGEFSGERINMNYHPGMFPYYEGDQPILGGIPQNGDLDYHINEFRKQVQEKVPININGYAVLDFESYQPDYVVTPSIYKNASREWVKSKHPDWSKEMVEIMAEHSFNCAARPFFEMLLQVGREMRPNAKWGYYHYPYCRNRQPNVTACLPNQIDANDRMQWLFRSSGVLFPSIYVFKNDFNVISRREQMKHRLQYALEVNKGVNADVLSYCWFKYHDATDTYLIDVDLWNTVGLSAELQLTGAVIWGSSNDVSSEKDCSELKTYVNVNLGPIVKYVTEHY